MNFFPPLSQFCILILSFYRLVVLSVNYIPPIRFYLQACSVLVAPPLLNLLYVVPDPLGQCLAGVKQVQNHQETAAKYQLQRAGHVAD